ncbi:hypothetical protein ABTZ03_20710 [Kitasatospora sp. NPDC096077]|uniref:hypothetical protein n=1 Tax=Kitasatospora sp. NPDC096077 TaxID=3155544 RepID=UPI00333292DB
MSTPLNFQQQLGAELTARAADLATAERPTPGTPVPFRPRPTRRLLTTGLGLAATVTAAVTVAVLVPQADTSPSAQAPQAVPTATRSAAGDAPTPVRLSTASYTVTPNQDGTVSVQLTGAEWSGLQEALRSVGVPALVMKPSASCHTPVTTDSSRLDAVMSLDPRNGRIAILHPAAVPPGERLLVLNTAPEGALHPGTVSALDISLTKETPTCFPLSQTNVVGVG